MKITKAKETTDALRSTSTSFRVAIASRRPLVAAVLAACAALATVACGESDDGVVKANGSAGGAKGGGKSGAAGTSNGGGGAGGGGQARIVPSSECAEISYFTATSSHVYLGDKSTLRRFALAGGAKETVDTYVTPASAGGQTNIVVSGDDVFYALSTGVYTEIRRARGGTSSVVFSVEQNESLRTLALAGESLYVLTTDGLYAVPIAGGAPVGRCASLFGENRRCPSLALDGASAYLSCYENTSPTQKADSLVRCDLATDVTTVVGTPAGDVHATPTGYVLNLAVAGDTLVYATTNYSLDVEIRALPKAGGADRLLATADHLFPRLASNATTVFFQDGLDPQANLTQVVALTVADGSKKTLSTQAAFPAGITLVGGSLYAAYFRADGKLCGVDAVQP